MAFGRLCAAGLTTMAELLDPAGPWSMDLVETMMPVATELELDRERQTHRAVMAAVGGLFKKEGAKEYTEAVQAVVDSIRAEQTVGTVSKRDLNAESADTIMELFSSSQYVTKGNGQKKGRKNGRSR